MGITLGSILASSITGYLCKYHGWPSVFYTSGTIITAIGVAYVLLITNDPKDHWFVTKEEHHYIVNNIAALKGKPVWKQSEQPKLRSIPWIKILTSVPVWAMIVVQYTTMLLSNVVIYKVSSYMSDVLQMNIDEIGYYNSVMYLVVGFRYVKV